MNLGTHLCPSNNINYETRPNSKVWNVIHYPGAKPISGTNGAGKVLVDVTKETPCLLILKENHCPLCDEKL